MRQASFASPLFPWYRNVPVLVARSRFPPFPAWPWFARHCALACRLRLAMVIRTLEAWAGVCRQAWAGGRESGAEPATHSAVYAHLQLVHFGHAAASMCLRACLAGANWLADSGGCVRKFAPCRIPDAASAP
eukprot:3312272-Pyramimonas_sp.AAC.1